MFRERARDETFRAGPHHRARPESGNQSILQSEAQKQSMRPEKSKPGRLSQYIETVEKWSVPESQVSCPYKRDHECRRKFKKQRKTFVHPFAFISRIDRHWSFVLRHSSHSL